MHALFVQFSGLVGLLIFLNSLWNEASLERTIFAGLASGLAVYFVLILGEATVRQILKHAPPDAAAETAGTPEKREQATAGDGKPPA